jgi:hypothetical protein
MDDASPEREGEGVVFAFMASRKVHSRRRIVNRWPALPAGNRSDGLGPHCRR